MILVIKFSIVDVSGHSRSRSHC